MNIKIEISLEDYKSLRNVLAQQKMMLPQLNLYAQGLHDGMELVFAMLEARQPELSEFELKQPH